MAEPFDTLMVVQAHDIAIDQLRHRIETLPERSELAEVKRRQADGGCRPVRGGGTGGRSGRPPAHAGGADRRRPPTAATRSSRGCRPGRCRPPVTSRPWTERSTSWPSPAVPVRGGRDRPAWRRRSRWTRVLAALRAESATLVAEAARLEAAIAEAEKSITVVHRRRGGGAGRARPRASRRPGRAVRGAALPPGRGGCGQVGGGPVRRLPSHPVLRRDRAHPPPAARRVRHLPPVRSHPGPLSPGPRAVLVPGRSAPTSQRPMLILVRHGESTGNADGLLLGRIDAPLTERGLAQARAVGALGGRCHPGDLQPVGPGPGHRRGPGHRAAGRDRRSVDRGRLRRVRRDAARIGPGRGVDAVAVGPGLPPPGRRDAHRGRYPGSLRVRGAVRHRRGRGTGLRAGGGGEPCVADQGGHLLGARASATGALGGSIWPRLR